MPLRIASADDPAVSVEGGRPPEFTRTMFRSAMAPASSPVASLASARSRISSSFRMIGMDEAVVGQMLKPRVEIALVGPSVVDWDPAAAEGRCESSPGTGYRAFRPPCSARRVWNDMCAYSDVFVAWRQSVRRIGRDAVGIVDADVERRTRRRAGVEERCRECGERRLPGRRSAARRGVVRRRLRLDRAIELRRRSRAY